MIALDPHGSRNKPQSILWISANANQGGFPVLRLVLASVLLVGCASTPTDPRWQQADARCEYQSEMASGPLTPVGGLYGMAARNMHAERLYRLCMGQAGY